MNVPTGRASALAVHATGFCKELWAPVTEDLAARGAHVDVSTIDLPGHGDRRPLPPPLDWWDLGRDVAAHFTGGRTLGIGHSSGATAIAMAEILRPGTFVALVLIEPIVFPGPYSRSDDNVLVMGALRRRARFASREEARKNWQGRGPFERWEDRALEAYVACGLRSSGNGFELACNPADEAEYYRSGYAHNAFDRLSEIGAPVTLVVGEHSRTHPPATVERLVGELRSAAVEVVTGATHFVPMEQPGAVAEIIDAVAES